MAAFKINGDFGGKHFERTVTAESFVLRDGYFNFTKPGDLSDVIVYVVAQGEVLSVERLDD